MRKLEAIRAVRRHYRAWGKEAVDRVSNMPVENVLASDKKMTEGTKG